MNQVFIPDFGKIYNISKQHSTLKLLPMPSLLYPQLYYQSYLVTGLSKKKENTMILPIAMLEL